MSGLLRLPLVVLLFAVLLVVIGCGSEENPEANRTTANAEDRLQGLVILFLRARGGIKDEIGLRKAYEALEDDTKQRLHLTSVEELFVSPRDQQPFVFNFQAKPGTPGMSSDVFAYEASGVKGKRFVALTSMDVRELTEEEFQQLKPK